MSQTTYVGPGASVSRERRNLRLTLQNWLGRDWAAAYIFVLPSIILLGGLIAYPFMNAVYLSFTNTVSLQTGPFVGLRNYETIWSDHSFRQSVRNTIVFTLSAVFFKFWIGLMAALLIKRAKRFGNILSGFILLPWIIPAVVTALTWRNLLDPVYGGVNQFLLQMNIIDRGFPWLGDYGTAMPSVVMVNVWQGIPFFTVMMLAGLSAIDHELYEAARIDGATAWRLFLHVTLPGLRYVIIVAVLLSTVWTFNSFTEIFLLTNGGPAGATKVYSILAWEYAVGGLRIGVGVAVAVTMAPILAIFIFLLGRYMSAGGRVEEGSGNARETTASRIGTLIAWPITMAFKGLLRILAVINDAVEDLFVAIGQRLRRLYVGNNAARDMSAVRFSVWLGGALATTALVLLLAFELIPFYWVIITAFKSNIQWTRFESVFWPQPWTLDQFETLFGPTRSFVLWYRNTAVVAVVSTVISVVVASMGAYGLTRLRWRGSTFFATIVLIAYLMPAVLMFIPIYQIFTILHLTNSLLGLMVAYPTFGLPFALWLMMGYYASIPRELEEAALIDGCNHFQAWWRVVLPLAAPALLATALFGFTTAWKEFLFAFIFLSKERLFTLSVGLAQMIIADVLPWGELMAASLLMAIPVIIVYMLGQRFMVAGLTAGAVKG